MKIAAVTISDRASDGTYEDKSGPAILAYLENAVTSHGSPSIRSFQMESRVSVRL